MFHIHGNYFFGNEISDYGKENGFVDYRTLAKAFDAVMVGGDFISKTECNNCGYWEQISGGVDNSDEIAELNEKIDELADEITEDSTDEQDAEISAKIDELRQRIAELEDDEENPPEIFTFFIVDNNGAEILKEAGEIVYYNDDLDLYLWGVTHWGTSWDYVLTNIPIETEDED